MSEYRITIPGVARGKGRPRFTTRNGKPGTFTDAKTLGAENWVKHCAIEQAGQPCLSGPIWLGVTITVGVPVSWPKKRRADALMGMTWPTAKPDVDNSIKLICDALNGIMWVDDAQIVTAHVRKQFGTEPSTALTVRSL